MQHPGRTEPYRDSSHREPLRLDQSRRTFEVANSQAHAPTGPNCHHAAIFGRQALIQAAASRQNGLGLCR